MLYTNKMERMERMLRAISRRDNPRNRRTKRLLWATGFLVVGCLIHLASWSLVSALVVLLLILNLAAESFRE